MSDIPENCMEPRLVKPVPETGFNRFIGEKEGTPAARKPVELSYPSWKRGCKQREYRLTVPGRICPPILPIEDIVVSPRLLILAARMSPMLEKKYENYKSSLQLRQYIRF
jgi:hypothetical protein